jgi:DNA polymerase III alpha subunit (gram-positive type)
VLYDHIPGSNVWTKLNEYSTLCYELNYPPQTPEIVALTGITDEMLLEGLSPPVAIEGLLPLVQEADLIVAHKVAFDRTVLLATCDRLGVAVPKKDWLCTLTNFPWPKTITCRKLSHIAYEHSILVDPKTLHRAVNDVELMFDILKTYNMLEVLTYANTPWVYLRAHPIEPWKDGEVQTNMAKKIGFTWQRVKYDEEREFKKMWVMRVKEFEMAQYEQVFHSVPFRVQKIEGIN